MTFERIDGICPNCGATRVDLLTSGLWDGWSGPELLPASGVCYTGRCERWGRFLRLCWWVMKNRTPRGGPRLTKTAWRRSNG
jgi:hypothetical protein